MAVEIRPKTNSLSVKVERNDHTTLTHRNEPNQHTISAITGLSEALVGLNKLIEDLQKKVDLHDDSSTEAIEGITQKLIDLITDTVNKEKERAEKEEQDIKDSLSTKLEKLDIDFNARVVNLDSKITNLDAHDTALKAEIVNLGDEVSARVDEFQQVKKDLADKISDENSRAIAAEKEIREIAQAECSRAQMAEERLVELINDETLRAQKQADNLQKIIGFVEVTSKERDTQLEKTINEEIARSTNYDDYLNTTLFAEIKRSTEVDSKLASIIDDETKRAQDEEARLKLYVDASIATEKNRATEAEKVLTDSIIELNSELTTKLETKADLVDGKIPNSQLPTTINIICEV